MTNEVPIYFNIFECGRDIFNILDVTYERACMAIPKEKYYMNLLDTLIDHNDRHHLPLFNEGLRKSVSKVMAETEEEERNVKHNTNNVDMDTFCQSPVTTNIQRNIASVPNERQMLSEILAETIKGFKRLTLQSTIKDSAYYNSEDDDAESNPKSNQVVATHTSDGKKRKFADADTTNRNSAHKLLIKRIIPEIVPVIMAPIGPTNRDGVASSGGTLHAHCTIISKDIVADAARSAARVFKYPMVVNYKDTYRTIAWDGNTIVNPPYIDYPSSDC